MLKALKDMQIGARIIRGNLLLLMLMGIVAVSGYTGMKRVAESNTLALQRRAEMADLRMLQLYIKNLYIYQTDYIRDGDPVSVGAFQNTIAPLQDFRAKIRKTVDSDEERLNLNIIDHQIDEYTALFLTKIVPARQSGDASAIDNLNQQSKELISQTDPFIQNMIADYEIKAEGAYRNAQTTESQTIIMIIGLSVLAGVVGLISGSYLARTISSGAQQIVLASEQIRRSEEALRESERFLDSIVENIPNMIFVKDAKDKRFIKVNRAMENLLGLQREEIYGKKSGDFFTQEQADFYEQKDQEALDSRGLVDIPEEFVDARASGRSILHIKKIPILGEDGTPKYLLSIAEDIAERKRTEDEIRQLNAELELRVQRRTAQLEVSNSELESFAYSISHDLRAPLRAMEGYSHILIEDFGPALNEQAQQYLRRISSNAHRMAELIDDLLNLSRVTRRELVFDQVDLLTLAKDAFNELRDQSPERTVEVILPEKMVAQADRGLMRVVMYNLIGNAWKYTGKRANAVIELGTLQQDGKTIYYIKDNGAGFDMAFVDKLFKPFQRLHSIRDFEGNGIGLAMVQRIIQRHGGRAWAEGCVDEGATIYFTLK